MPRKFYTTAIGFLLICCCTQASFAVPWKQSRTGETKLVVLKMTFENFREEDQESFKVAFYKELSRLEGVDVVPEPSGSQETDPFDVLKQVQSDFGLIANMVKVGTFVRVKIEILSSSNDTTEALEAGTSTIDWPGIPAIIAQLDEKIPKQPLEEPGLANRSKGFPWKFVIGGVALGGGVATAIFLLKNEPGDLPAPDSLPERP